MELLRRAINNGVDSAAGNHEKNKTFLSEILKDAGYYQKEYLQDIHARYEYMNNPSGFGGRNGIELCSDNYIDYYIKYIFGKSFSQDIDFFSGVIKATGRLIITLGNDLEDGIKNNDYIKDENAVRILDIIKEQERFGANLSALKEKAEKLSWFVGGDEYRIKQLQRNLNELGITGDSGKLLEDGVYGKDTLKAWRSFVYKIETGTVQTLAWVNPLQSDITGIKISSTKYGENMGYKNALEAKNEYRYVRIDPPHIYKSGSIRYGDYRGKNIPIDYNHINFDNSRIKSNILFDKIHARYNHHPLTDEAYGVLKNIDGFGKTIRIGGRVLLIAGIILDTLELGFSIYYDLNDIDKKLGRQTTDTVITIGSRWVGAIAGAEIGALIGTLAGPAAPVVVPVFAIVGGIAGTFGGDAFAKWIIDITCVEG